MAKIITDKNINQNEKKFNEKIKQKIVTLAEEISNGLNR